MFTHKTENCDHETDYECAKKVLNYVPEEGDEKHELKGVYSNKGKMSSHKHCNILGSVVFYGTRFNSCLPRVYYC